MYRRVVQEVLWLEPTGWNYSDGLELNPYYLWIMWGYHWGVPWLDPFSLLFRFLWHRGGESIRSTCDSRSMCPCQKARQKICWCLSRDPASIAQPSLDCSGPSFGRHPRSPIIGSFSNSSWVHRDSPTPIFPTPNACHPLYCWTKVGLLVSSLIPTCSAWFRLFPTGKERIAAKPVALVLNLGCFVSLYWLKIQTDSS